MGGLFGVASNKDCVNDLFFGIDYHSHLGTHRGGMAVSGQKGFQRAIHNIENAPFRTKFDTDVRQMHGRLGIGCISDTDPQPIIVRARFGSFVLTTVGKINNENEILDRVLRHSGHFQELTTGNIGQTEIAASVISSQNSLLEGLILLQKCVEGSISVLAMTKDAIYAVRDQYGRTPLILGEKHENGENSKAVSFESFAYQNLGYQDERILGPGEIVRFDDKNIEILKSAGEEMKICSFLWTYYGYPSSNYEGVSVEQMRNRCGMALAGYDQNQYELDYAAGVPDSGTAHALGYANASGVSFGRPLIKYTPTWPRSFMPSSQKIREKIAQMKLIKVDALVKDKNLLFIDDSIVRGTQMRDTAAQLKEHGAKQVHVRSACPPILYGCKYLNFSRSTSDYDLISRRTIKKLEGKEPDSQVLARYADDTTPEYQKMVESIQQELQFDSLKYLKLDDLVKAVGLEPCKLCTYCWNGKE